MEIIDISDLKATISWFKSDFYTLRHMTKKGMHHLNKSKCAPYFWIKSVSRHLVSWLYFPRKHFVWFWRYIYKLVILIDSSKNKQCFFFKFFANILQTLRQTNLLILYVVAKWVKQKAAFLIQVSCETCFYHKLLKLWLKVFYSVVYHFFVQYAQNISLSVENLGICCIYKLYTFVVCVGGG